MLADVLELRPVPEDGSLQSIVEGRSWRDAWDAHVVALAPGGFLQFWGWGEHMARFGGKVERWVLVFEGRPIGFAQVILERARAGLMASLPHGPVCVAEAVVMSEMFARLREAYLGRVVALRFEPAWPDSDAARDTLVGIGLRSAVPVQPMSTLVLDLRPDEVDGEAALLAEMHQKCRYNIGLATRRAVNVERLGPDELDSFEEMLLATARRHGLSTRPQGYHRSAFQAFEPTGVLLYGARYDSEILSMILVARAGDRATYLYGASTERERGRMPNHALQWQAISDARMSGCRVYDFWGIPDELGRAARDGLTPESVPEGESGLWGVWKFKRGFGGRIERRVGRWDDVVSPFRYAVGVRLPAAVRRRRAAEDSAE